MPGRSEAASRGMVRGWTSGSFGPVLATVCAVHCPLVAATGCAEDPAPPPRAAFAKPTAAAEPAPPPLPPLRVPAGFPSNLDRTAYAGSAACKECHEEIYAQWKDSPHGRASLPATGKAARGDFSAEPLVVDGGRVEFRREGASNIMRVVGKNGARDHVADLYIGYGRQHQVYLTRGDDDVYRILPAIWTTPERRWIPASLYQPASLDPSSGSYWLEMTLADAGCVNCHVSQGGYRLGPVGLETTWLETPVNCESCHGPAAEHTARHKAKLPVDKLPDLKAIGKVQEARVCGVCHAARWDYRADVDEIGRPWFAHETLRVGNLRADGTQLQPAYQYTGHVLSECYQRGAMMCGSCHAPHTDKARSLADESAEGEHSDRQCTVCHRNYIDGPPDAAHASHPRSVRCVDCHMAYSWIGDSPEAQHRTSDHSISVPHPQETIDVGVPNACTSCHDHEDESPQWALEWLAKWGAKDSLATRGWVRAVHLGRERAPGASAALTAVLADPSTGPYLRASVLDLLALQGADPGVVPVARRSVDDPDPWVRALAYRALIENDRPHAERWRTAGLEDAHAFVRLTVFPLTRDLSKLTDDGLERHLRDTFAWCQRPPTAELRNVARALSGRGRHARAMEVLVLAERYSTPRERRTMRLSDVRRELEQRALGRAPAGRPRRPRPQPPGMAPALAPGPG